MRYSTGGKKDYFDIILQFFNKQTIECYKLLLNNALTAAIVIFVNWFLILLLV